MATITYEAREITSLLNLVDTYVRWKTVSKRSDRSYAHYHPSEWGKCLRMQQYKHYAWKGLIDVKYAEPDSTKQRLFDKGHNMHIRWQEYFADMGVLMGKWKCKNLLCNMFNDQGNPITAYTYGGYDADKARLQLYESKKSRIYGEDEPIFKPDKCVCGCRNFEYLETKVEAPELNIKGRADVILNCDNLTEDRFQGVRMTYNPKYLPRKGGKVVGDMKTIGSKSWANQLKKRGPHKDYLVQLTIYAHILNCDFGIIMYENKDNSEMLWYQVPKNDRWWEIVQEQAKIMIEMASDKKRKKLPPPKYEKKNTYACKYCDFRNLCHQSKIWSSPNLEKNRNDFYKDLL